MITFLDVDGVLNSEEWSQQCIKETGKGGWGGWFKETDKITKDDVLWKQELVDRVKKIITSTNSAIVMSSTWRLHFSVNKFREMFALYGWEDAPVIDKTPVGTSGRGVEVDRYISQSTSKDYVIIDDVDQFLVHQKPRYVQTDIMTGITDEDVEKAIKILKNE